MPKDCKAKNPESCSYHGRTLISKEYKDLLLIAKQISSESSAMQTIVKATNMNPDVLLKEIRQKEQNIVARIDSTVEGLSYLETIAIQYKDDLAITEKLISRRQAGLMLSHKRIKLSDEIENHKREWLPKVRGREARVMILNSFIQVKIDTLRGATEQFSEIESLSAYHASSNNALIEELEEIRENLTIDLI